MASSESTESSIKKQIDDVGEYVDNIGKGLRAAYGRKASRVYNIFTNEFKPNVAGNLRGQIQDKAARIMHGRMSLALNELRRL